MTSSASSRLRSRFVASQTERTAEVIARQKFRCNLLLAGTALQRVGPRKIGQCIFCRLIDKCPLRQRNGLPRPVSGVLPLAGQRVEERALADVRLPASAIRRRFVPRPVTSMVPSGSAPHRSFVLRSPRRAQHRLLGCRTALVNAAHTRVPGTRPSSHQPGAACAAQQDLFHDHRFSDRQIR